MKIVAISMIMMLCIACAAQATFQEEDVLVWDGTTNDMYSTPLEALFSPDNPKPKLFFEHSLSTACWRGYVGTWKIEGGELLLYALRQGHGTNLISLVKIDQEWTSPVKAVWFTGTIRIGRGKWVRGMGWRSGDLSPIREVDIFMNIEKGRLVSTRQVDNKLKNGEIISTKHVANTKE
jgi:hypothetical protein